MDLSSHQIIQNVNGSHPDRRLLVHSWCLQRKARPISARKSCYARGVGLAQFIPMSELPSRCTRSSKAAPLSNSIMNRLPANKAAMSELPSRRKRSSNAALLPNNLLNEPPAKKAVILECDLKNAVAASPSPALTVSDNIQTLASAVAFDASSLDEGALKMKNWTKDAYVDVLARQNLCIQHQRVGSEWQVALDLPPVDPKVYIADQKFVLGRDFAHALHSFKLTKAKVLGAGAFGIVVQGELDGKPGAVSLVAFAFFLTCCHYTANCANSSWCLFHSCAQAPLERI